MIIIVCVIMHIIVIVAVNSVWQCLDAWLHIIARKQTSDAIHDALPPAIVVLLEHIQHRALLEAELVIFVSIVIVNGDH